MREATAEEISRIIAERKFINYILNVKGVETMPLGIKQVRLKCNRHKNISIDKIKIPKCFTIPSTKKLIEKSMLYAKDGEYGLDPIIIDEDYVIIDGYVSYYILKEQGVTKTTVYRVGIVKR